jgi:hypothetical protein
MVNVVMPSRTPVTGTGAQFPYGKAYAGSISAFQSPDRLFRCVETSLAEILLVFLSELPSCLSEQDL